MRCGQEVAGLPSKARPMIPGAARVLAMAAVAIAVAACGGGAGPQAVASIDPTAAYEGLPPCDAAPAAAEPVPTVAGLVLPSGATIQSASDSGPITTVNAYAPATPLAIEQDLVARDDVDILHNENEVFETEMLFSDGTHRSFLKAVAVCDQGSQIVAVVVAEDDAGALPSPGAAAGG